MDDRCLCNRENLAILRIILQVRKYWSVCGWTGITSFTIHDITDNRPVSYKSISKRIKYICSVYVWVLFRWFFFHIQNKIKKAPVSLTDFRFIQVILCTTREVTIRSVTIYNQMCTHKICSCVICSFKVCTTRAFILLRDVIFARWVYFCWISN